jgi:hypothetical protein
MAEQKEGPDPAEVTKAAAKAAEPKKASPPTREAAHAENVAKASAKAAQPKKAQARGTATTEDQQETAIDKALKKLKKDGYRVNTEPYPADSAPVSGAYGAVGEAPRVDAGTVRTGAE